MASPSATFVFVGLLLFALVQISLSLNCYQCGKMHSGCNDPFDNKTAPNYALPCPKGSTTCIKIVNPNTYDVSGRRCGNKDSCDDFVRCYSCKGELCNGSSNVLPSIFLIGVTGLIYSFIKY